METNIAANLGFTHDSEPKLDRYRPFCLQMHLILADQLADIPDVNERLRLHTQAIENAWLSIKLRKVCPFESVCPMAPPPRWVQTMMNF
jgi:hypothetical protein